MTIEASNLPEIYNQAEIAILIGAALVILIFIISLFLVLRISDKYNDLIKYYLNKNNSEIGYYYYIQASNLEESFSPRISKLFCTDISFRHFKNLEKIIDKNQFTKLQEIKFLKLDLLQEQRLKFQEDNNDSSLYDYFETEAANETKFTIDFITDNNEKKFIECTFEIVSRTNNHPIGLVIWFKDISKNMLHIKQIQDELTQSQKENKFHCDILNNLSIPIWARDKNNNIFYCNNEYQKIVNLNNDRHLNIPELDKTSVSIAKMAKMLNQIHKEEKYIIAKSERKLFSICETPFSDNLLLGFALDQSEKETISQELQQYSATQNNLLETSSSAIAIYTADSKIKYFNQAFINLWELDENWLFTRPTHGEILEELRQKRKLPEQANFAAFKKERMKLFTHLSETYNEFMYLPDGKSLRMIVIPFALGGLLFAFEDMTSRLALERSLNSLNAVQRAMLNNLSEAIAVFGQDGRLKLYNPAYLKLFEMDAEYAANAPHISDILESKKHLFHAKDTNWESIKNDLISALYERELQRSTLKLNNGLVIYRTVSPLPDGATLITYVNNSELVKCESSLSERNMILNDFFLFQHQFIINIAKQIGSKDLQEEIISLSNIHLTSINTNLSIIDIKEIISRSIKICNNIDNKNITLIFNNNYKASIIGNYNRINAVLDKIFGYIKDITSSNASLKLEVSNNDKILLVNFSITGNIAPKNMVEEKFLLIQSILEVYGESLTISTDENGFRLILELPQLQTNTILENNI